MSQAYFTSEWSTLEHHTLLFRDPTNAQRRFIPVLIENCKLPDVIVQFAYIDWREKSEEAYARLLAASRPVEELVVESHTPKKGKEIMRDDFSDEVKRITAARVGNRCSNSSCRALTSGPQVDPSKALNVGVAAHITAASPGGPRYNPALKPEERSHFTNAIWLCQNCAKLVDNDAIRFTEDLLRRWKHEAEDEALSWIGKTASSSSYAEMALTNEEIALLLSAADSGELVIIDTHQTEKWVRAGIHDFLDPTDPAFAAIHVDALESLCNRRFARYEGGILYMLTGTGFKIARSLNSFATVTQ